MINHRMSNYASFFSHLKQSAGVDTESIRQSLTAQYNKAKNTANKLLTSQSAECAKQKITQIIGQENINKLDYTYTAIEKNYTWTKQKISEWIATDEIIKIKSLFDGSVKAILATNLLFDLGLMLVPAAGSAYNTLQYSKYIIAISIFILSACQSYDDRKDHHDTHQKPNVYEAHINHAYEVTAQLKELFLVIENYLQEINLISSSSYITSKDFEISRQSIVGDSKEASYTKEMLLYSFLNGATKSAGTHSMINYLGRRCLPDTHFSLLVKGLALTTTLVIATVNELRKQKEVANDEEKLKTLKNKLEPIHAILQKLEKKLSIHSGDEKPNLQKVELPQDIDIHLQSLMDGAAKTSGLQFMLNTYLPEKNKQNFLICFITFLCSIYHSYVNHIKQKNKKVYQQALDEKINDIVHTTEKMKILLANQSTYVSFLQKNAPGHMQNQEPALHISMQKNLK